MPAKQTIVIKTTTRTRSKTKKSNKKGNTKKGNPSRCTKCGRFM